MFKDFVFSQAQKPFALLLCFGFTLGNYWIWKIVGQNIFIALLLLCLSISLFSVLTYDINRRAVFLTAVLFIMVAVVSVKLGFNQQFWWEKPVSIALRNERHGLLSEGLGPLFTNRLVQIVYRNGYSLSRQYQSNLAYNLSPNIFFFNNHPREYSGVDEYEKFLPLFLPLAILGGLFLLITSFKKTVLYLAGAGLISGLIAPGNIFGSILFFPIINAMMVFGVLIFLAKFYKK